MIDRLAGLHLDDAEQLSASIGGLQDDIRKQWGRRRTDRHRLFHARIDADLEFLLVLRLKQANHPVVLQLFADRPHQDRAQYSLRNHPYPKPDIVRRPEVG